MGEIKKFAVRSCPICRVAMVHADDGWHCPQCGSVIVDGPKSERRPREQAPEPAAHAARGGLRR
jgi:ribosomal protein S27AE